MSWSADDGGEDGSWGIVSGEAGFAHAGAIIHNKSGNFVVTHVWFVRVLSDGNTQENWYGCSLLLWACRDTDDWTNCHTAYKSVWTQFLENLALSMNAAHIWETRSSCIRRREARSRSAASLSIAAASFWSTVHAARGVSREFSTSAC